MIKAFAPWRWALLLLFFVGVQAWARPETPPGEAGERKTLPIEVQSRTLEVDDAKQVVTFQGAVHAVQEEFVIDCDRLLVFYTGRPQESGEGEGTRIDRIVATGNVRIQRAKGGTATAEKAVFHQEEEKLVLTGNPMVRQGKDQVQGERITLFLRENRSVVESAGDRRVKAVIFPRRKAP